MWRRILPLSLVALAIFAVPAAADPSPGTHRLGARIRGTVQDVDVLAERIVKTEARLDEAKSDADTMRQGIRAARIDLVAQDVVLTNLRDQQDVAWRALFAVQAQVALTGDPTGSTIPVELGPIADIRVRWLIVETQASSPNVLGSLVAHANDVTDQIDLQLDYSRELLISVHEDEPEHDRLKTRKRALDEKAEKLRRTATVSRAELDELIDVSAGGRVGPSPAEVALTGQGPFFVCPVDPPRVIADDFGAPRYGGGYHQHEGNDILAPEGTPIRAPFDGSAEDATNGLGGIAVRISGADGYVYNAHLTKIATLGRVRAGEIVGYVGNTGDAAGGPTHDHFEWHPDGAGAVDPHDELSSVC